MPWCGTSVLRSLHARLSQHSSGGFGDVGPSTRSLERIREQQMHAADPGEYSSSVKHSSDPANVRPSSRSPDYTRERQSRVAVSNLSRRDINILENVSHESTKNKSTIAVHDRTAGY